MDPSDAASTEVSELLLSKGVCTKAADISRSGWEGGFPKDRGCICRPDPFDLKQA